MMTESSLLHASLSPDRDWPGGRVRSILVIATLAFWILISVFVTHPFTPDVPHPGLDPSWMAVTGEAAAARARWGLDIVFTYGPAAPLATQYFNDDYVSRTLPLLIGIGFVHALCAACLLCHGGDRGFGALYRSALAIACYGVVLVATRQNPDTFFFNTVFLVFLLDLQRQTDDRIARLATALGVVATGVFCLSKLSYGLMALPLFILGDLRALYRRGVPFRTAGMAAAFLATDLAYGQRLGDLSTFLAMQKEIIAGYTDAMSLGGYRLETAAFLVLAGGLWALVCGAEFSSRRLWAERCVAPAGLAVFLLMIFKAGFVRQDLHTLTSWLSFALIGVVMAFTRIMPRWRRGAAALIAASLFCALIVYPYMVAISNDEPNRLAAMVDTYGEWFSSGPPEEIAAMGNAIRDPRAFAASLRQQKAEAWAAIREADPQGKLDGTVDIVQSDQSSIMASGLDYRFRPIFQEYSTYTAELMRVNREFYESDRAPDWVLMAPGSIDGRYPAFAEGSLWPDLIRRYEPVLRLKDTTALHRRSTPMAEILGPGRTQVAGFNIAVPLGEPGPLYARIIVKPTLLGRLMSFFYRAPLLTMVVRFGTGEERAFRFVPALGAGGFVLSPMVASADEFAALAIGRAESSPDAIVTEVKIVADVVARRAYAADVTYEFAPISVPSADHSPMAEPLDAALVEDNRWRDLVRRLGRQAKLKGDLLPLQPPESLTIPIGGARHLSLRFGIEPEAWSKGGTDGVCFDVKAKEGIAPIWQRCLDPKANEADRGDHSGRIDLPEGLDSVVIETTCRATCDWDWAYIRDARPE